MGGRLEPADRGKQTRAEDGPLELRAMGEIEIDLGVLIFQQAVLGHVNRRLGQFNILNSLEVASRSQSQPPRLASINFKFDDFVNLLWRQGLAELSLMTGLPARSGQFAITGVAHSHA